MRKWTQDYKQWLEELVAGIDSKASKAPKPKSKKKPTASQDDDMEVKEEKEEVKGSKVLIGGIKSFKENHTDTTVRFSVSSVIFIRAHWPHPCFRLNCNLMRPQGFLPVRML